ncbi:MAG: transglycosylase SLT domain-containing protein [Patescibacteria group bacterium]
MRDRKRLLAVAFAAASMLAGLSARAEGCGRSDVFEMADGMYFHVSSGLKAPACPQLARLLEAGPTPIVEEAPAPQPAPEIPPAPPSSAYPMRDAVGRARTMLQARIKELNDGKKPEIVSSYDIWVDITLAVWNEKTGEIRLIEAKKSGFKIDAPVPVSVKRNNGVNSEFILDDPEDIAVGVRYPIFKDVTVTKRKPRYELHDVVYAPYSKRLHAPETVAWGRETLDADVKEAYDAYRAAGIRSRAFPDRLLVDVIKPEQLEAIAIIEHLSEGSLLGSNARSVMESVYVVLGANQDDAYAYSRSSMGAKGIFQFIPSTYKLMAARKELGLDPDFESGMAHPVNAIKAAVAYLDAELAGMPLAVKDLYYVNNDRVIEYLAAAYNGGGTRIRRAVKMWGDAWSEPHAAEIAALSKKKGSRSLAVTQMKNATLRDETISYVKKLRQTLVLLRPSPLAGL